MRHHGKFKINGQDCIACKHPSAVGDKVIGHTDIILEECSALQGEPELATRSLLHSKLADQKLIINANSMGNFIAGNSY